MQIIKHEHRKTKTTFCIFSSVAKVKLLSRDYLYYNNLVYFKELGILLGWVV